MRTIKVFNSKTNQVTEIQSSATKWKDLIGELPGYEAGMRGVDRETQNTFEAGEATLPTGNFTLFLVPSKVKSGHAI